MFCAFRVLLVHSGNMLAGMFPFLRGKTRWPSCDDPIYRKREVTRGARVYNVVAGTAAFLAFRYVYLPALVLSTAFYVPALLPQWLVFPVWLRRLVVRFSAELVEGPGDQYALMLTEVASKAVEGKLLEVLRPLLQEPVPEEGSRYQSATVIAHSGGATASFRALSSPSLWRELGGVTEPQIDMTFITVGSALNVSHENVPNHPMWHAPLPERVDWVDIWARYDWAPHGPPSRKLQQKVRGGSGRFCTQRVVNLDSVFSDHHHYWGNHEEVTSRLVYEIARRPAEGSPPESSAGRIRSAVDEMASKIREHRHRVGTINLVRIVAISLGFAAVYSLGSMEAVGAWLLERLKLDFDVTAVERLLSLALGAAAYALIVNALWRAVNLWFGALLYKEPWEKG